MGKIKGVWLVAVVGVLCMGVAWAGAPSNSPVKATRDTDIGPLWVDADDDGAAELHVTPEGAVVVGTPDSTATAIWVKDQDTGADVYLTTDSDDNTVGLMLRVVRSEETAGVISSYEITLGRDSTGLIGMVSSTKAYSAAPDGDESPIERCRVWSDGTGSSPWDVEGWVIYNGSSWGAE
jgi:hypothetical protein